MDAVVRLNLCGNSLYTLFVVGGCFPIVARPKVNLAAKINKKVAKRIDAWEKTTKTKKFQYFGVYSETHIRMCYGSCYSEHIFVRKGCVKWNIASVENLSWYKFFGNVLCSSSYDPHEILSNSRMSTSTPSNNLHTFRFGMYLLSSNFSCIFRLIPTALSHLQYFVFVVTSSAFVLYMRNVH